MVQRQFMKSFNSGKLINQGSYKSFQPEKINRPWLIDDMEVLELLGKADRHLGRLDMYSEYIPNINLFINMHVFKEATQSSKIEGTQTNIEIGKHTSELQSRGHLVCRLLLEKKK